MELAAEDFKQTEVGVIPSDWVLKKLGEVADIKTGPFGSSLHEKDYVNDGTPIITVEHLSDLGIVHENMPMVSEFDRKRLCAYAMQTNDIVFSRVGSVDRNSMVGERENGWLFSGRLLRIRFNSKTVLPKFVSYHFQQETFKQRIRSVAVGQTMASLNTQILKGVDVVFPPTQTEQIAIATALSDADALISSLEKLIAKKRNIKQGAMQKLLQPKDGWEVKKLGEVLGKVTTGKLDANAMKENGEYRFYTCAKDYYFIDEYAFDTEALLISGNGANVGYIHYYKGKFNAYQRTYVLTDFGIDVFYIKLYLDSYLKDRITTEVSAGNTPYIKMDTITEMFIHYPINTTEQTRIATILSDMDAEISSLESKLEKYKKVKLGMMQNLLTGKIRLV